MRRLLFVLPIFFISVSISFSLERDFDVNASPVPPMLSMFVEFSEPSGNRVLDAEETANLAVTLKNSGKGNAYDVVLKISTDRNLSGISFPAKIDIGTLEAGKSVRKDVQILTSDILPSGKVTFYVKAEEVNGFNPKPSGVAFNTRKFLEPVLKVVDFKIIDSNRNGRIEPVEQVEIRARVQNIGRGPAYDVNAEVVLGQNVFIGGSLKTDFSLGNLGAGEFKDVSFIIYANSLLENGETIPVKLGISEQKGRFGSKEDIKMVMYNPDNAGTVKVVDAAVEKASPEIEVSRGLSSEIERNIPEGFKKAGDYDVAVVIGNSSYKHVQGVDFALDDARMMKKYLVKTFGFREGNIIYAENATLSEFNRIFGGYGESRSQLKNYVKSGVSSVFIYYVGHGAPDLNSNEAYFVPVDADPQYISSGGYKLQQFYDNIGKIKAKHITIVIDACFSGDSAKGLLFKNVSPGALRVKEQYQKPATANVIASSSFREVSTWYPEKGHSMFTYWFLSGLQGGADASGDKKITIGEMANYLKEHVTYEARKQHGVDQNPVVDGNPATVLVTLK